MSVPIPIHLRRLQWYAKLKKCENTKVLTQLRIKVVRLRSCSNCLSIDVHFSDITAFPNLGLFHYSLFNYIKLL